MTAKRMEVYARWELEVIPPNIDEDIYISCGVNEEQFEGYMLADKGARLTITRTGGARRPYLYVVELSAPSMGLEKLKGYWLSPCTLGANEVEAVDFRIRKAA